LDVDSQRVFIGVEFVAGAALVMAVCGDARRRRGYVSGFVALTALSLVSVAGDLMWVVVNHGDAPVGEISGAMSIPAVIDDIESQERDCNRRSH